MINLNGFKFIPEFPEYLISPNGDVYSIKNKKLLKRGISSNGYQKVTLFFNNLGKVKSIHRLVWETHKDLIPKGLCINHINGIKDDNRLENLEIVTYKENTHHAWKLGLAVKRYGEANPTSKLTPTQVAKIRLNKTLTQRELSEIYGVSQSQICRLKNYIRWPI